MSRNPPTQSYGTQNESRDDASESLDSRTPPAAPARPAVPGAIPDVLPLDKVAERLGVTRADVLDLVRRGLLPAKRIGASIVITSAALAEYVNKPDHRASFARFEPDQAVIVMDADGAVTLGRFVAETSEGNVRVRRSTLLGTREDIVYPSQVQPFTCRAPSHARQS